MKKLLYITILFSLTACQTKTVSESKTVDTVAVDTLAVDTAHYDEQTIGTADPVASRNTSSPEVIESVFTIDFARTDAIIGPDNHVYSDTSEEATNLWDTQTMEMVFINKEVSKKDPYLTDFCEQKYWYYVTFLSHKDTTAWVNGVDVLLKPNVSEGKIYTINATKYILYMGTDSGNPDGPGCLSYAIPYFYNEEKKTISFLAVGTDISIPSSAFVDRYGRDWLTLISSSDTGSASLQHIDIEEGTIRMYLNVSYQEGGAKAIVYVNENNGMFTVASVENIEEINDGQ